MTEEIKNPELEKPPEKSLIEKTQELADEMFKKFKAEFKPPVTAVPRVSAVIKGKLSIVPKFVSSHPGADRRNLK